MKRLPSRQRGPTVGDLIRARRRLLLKIKRMGAEIRAQGAVIQELKGSATMNERTPLTPTQQALAAVQQMRDAAALLDQELIERDGVIAVLQQQRKELTMENTQMAASLTRRVG